MRNTTLALAAALTFSGCGAAPKSIAVSQEAPCPQIAITEVQKGSTVTLTTCAPLQLKHRQCRHDQMDLALKVHGSDASTSIPSSRTLEINDSDGSTRTNWVNSNENGDRCTETTLNTTVDDGQHCIVATVQPASHQVCEIRQGLTEAREDAAKGIADLEKIAEELNDTDEALAEIGQSVGRPVTGLSAEDRARLAKQNAEVIKTLDSIIEE